LKEGLGLERRAQKWGSLNNFFKMKEKKHFFTLLKGLALDPITMEAPIMRPVEGLKISKGLKGV